eukprot:GHVL01036137.1.p1 GENE.GHVL01036137.1~~GHVL01036137.1.p1  ORF type:complete len:307 (-),score=38.25 GHVL01036137.1:302-1222(-)
MCKNNLIKIGSSHQDPNMTRDNTHPYPAAEWIEITNFHNKKIPKIVLNNITTVRRRAESTTGIPIEEYERELTFSEDFQKYIPDVVDVSDVIAPPPVAAPPADVSPPVAAPTADVSPPVPPAQASVRRPVVTPQTSVRPPVVRHQVSLLHPVPPAQASVRRLVVTPQTSVRRPVVTPQTSVRRPQASVRRPVVTPQASLLRPVVTPQAASTSQSPQTGSSTSQHLQTSPSIMTQQDIGSEFSTINIGSMHRMGIGLLPSPKRKNEDRGSEPKRHRSAQSSLSSDNEPSTSNPPHREVTRIIPVLPP